MLKLLLIGICCFIVSVQSKLYQVYALARHGARYHSTEFYDGNDTKPRWLQLTAVGMRQHQRFGQLVRKQYVDSLKFLSSNYKQSQIQIYSTHTNRTITSGQSFVYGLYPPGTGPGITFVDRYLRLPPYSNKTDIEQQNYALPRAHQQIKTQLNQKIILTDCPNYVKYQQQNFDAIADTVAQMNLTYYPYFKRMSSLFNYTVKNTSKDNLLQITRVYDASSVDKFLGRPLPSAFTEQDYKNSLHLTNWYYLVAMNNNNSFMANTFKIQKLINAFDLRVRLPDSYALKWTHLFGHDTDLLAFHLAMNTSSATCVQQIYRKGSTKATQCETEGTVYASNIIVQLHSDNAKDFYVKVRSNGKYLKLCSKGQLQCDYLEFKTLIKKSMTTKSMDDICGKVIKQQTDNISDNLNTKTPVKQSKKMQQTPTKKQYINQDFKPTQKAILLNQ